MKNPDKQEVLDKKVRARLREDILKEIDTTVKQDIVKSVVSDVKESFNEEYKNEIKEEIKSNIKVDIEDAFKKDQKKLSRKKNFKIFRLNIYVVLLIICSLFLVYRLYVTGNFEIKVVEKNSTTDVITTTTGVVHDFKWLKEKYGNLLNKVYINNVEYLKNKVELSSLPIEEKLVMAYKNISDVDKNREGIITKITSNKLKTSYDSLFYDNNYKATNFQTNGLNFAYSDSSEEYIAVGDEVKGYSILNSISDIKEDKNLIVITSNVACLNNNNIYNIYDLDEPLKENSNDISDILDKLTKVDYVFEYRNSEYYLIKIENK